MAIKPLEDRILVKPIETESKTASGIYLPESAKVFVPSWEDVPGEVAGRAREGDVVVTMGAPPISLMGDELLTALAERAAANEDGPAGRHARAEVVAAVADDADTDR